MNTCDRGILTKLERLTPRGRMVYFLFFLLLCILAVTVVFPFVFAFTSGLKSSTEIYKGVLPIFPTTPQWENYTSVWEKYHFIRLFGNSLVLVGGGVFLQL